MIASRRGLIVLGALVLALFVVVIIDHPRRGPVDHALVPGFDAARVTSLELVRAGQPDIAVRRTGETWQLATGTADPATVDAMLAALRGARWHRRAGKASAGEARATLTISAGKPTILTIGRALPGSEQTWIAHGDHAYLVDNWVASALAPDPIALVIRHPLAACAGARAIAISSPHLRIEGTRLVEPTPLALDPALLDALYDACARLEIVALAPSAQAEEPTIWLEHPDVVVQATGGCSGNRVHIAGATTAGCVERAAWDKLVAAIAALARPADQIADRRPLALKPTALAFGTTKIDLRNDVDPERVTELLAALAAPAKVVAHPQAKPTTTIVASDGTAQVTLELYAGVVARQGESIALQPTPEAWSVIARPASALRDQTLWHEDPLTITAFTLDQITFTRGAVIGEWTRAPAGSIDTALVEAVVEALGSVRAPSGSPPSASAHRLAFTVTPPAGKPTSHTLELGAPSAAGCAARIDGVAVTAPLALCTAAAALAAKR